MKLKLSQGLQQVLGMIKNSESTQITVDPEQLDELQMVLERLLAAIELSDIEAPIGITIKNQKEDSYYLGLKFKWEWPVPCALELKAVKEDIWEIDIVETRPPPGGNHS